MGDIVGRCGWWSARERAFRAIAEPIGDDVGRAVRAGAARVFRGSTDRAHHELRDDAVEPAPLVPVPLVREAQLLEVLRRLRGDVLLELHRDATELWRAVPADLHVEPHLGVRGVDLERGRVAHGLVDDLEDVFGGGLTAPMVAEARSSRRWREAGGGVRHWISQKRARNDATRRFVPADSGCAVEFVVNTRDSARLAAALSSSDIGWLGRFLRPLARELRRPRHSRARGPDAPRARPAPARPDGRPKPVVRRPSPPPPPAPGGGPSRGPSHVVPPRIGPSRA